MSRPINERGKHGTAMCWRRYYMVMESLPPVDAVPFPLDRKNGSRRRSGSVDATAANAACPPLPSPLRHHGPLLAGRWLIAPTGPAGSGRGTSRRSHSSFRNIELLARSAAPEASLRRKNSSSAGRTTVESAMTLGSVDGLPVRNIAYRSVAVNASIRCSRETVCDARRTALLCLQPVQSMIKGDERR
jgi:hypothetical protein